MRAGRLKNRVSLQSYTTTQDSTGFPTKTWATYATVWAGVEADNATESESAGELISVQKTTIIIRYSSTVKAISEKDRVLFGTRIFSVEGVTLPSDRSGSNAFIELRCIEGKKDGG